MRALSRLRLFPLVALLTVGLSSASGACAEITHLAPDGPVTGALADSAEAALGDSVAMAPRDSAAATAPEESAAAVPDEAYIEHLLAEAERQGLHEDRYWHILLHYKRGLFGLRSLVDDPKFFADPNGKHDPRAELRATIRSLFCPSVADEKHAVCRYVARYEWLKERLGIDPRRLPVPQCTAFEVLLAKIQPESATLIFPTSHMNSPASMYGHTLLTVETASKSKLLAFAINYSAIVQGVTFAPVFIAKGLCGGYPGYYSILPYYAKLQEYSDVNDRDIWEYALSLDRDEIRRMLLHIYELDNIYSNYYFVGENCSYGLLFLLEAARPSVHLTDRFGWWVIPLDTIRAIRKSGLIEEAIYRPSRSTKVEYLAGSISPAAREDAWGMARGKREPEQVLAQAMSQDDKIRICDLACEYLQYLNAKGKIEKELYQVRFLKALGARSSLGEAAEWRDSIPPPGRPDDGHRSRRWAIGAGTHDEESFLEIRLRPAYHELLDYQSGYKRGSQIVFLDAALRYYAQQERVKVEAIRLVDIVSIAPRSRFFEHLSWKVNTGFFPNGQDRRREDLIWGLNVGLGLAYDAGILGLVYGFAETDLHVGGTRGHGYALGAGGSAGVIKDLTDWWKVQLLARYLDHPLGDEMRQLRVSLGQGLKLSTNLGLSATVARGSEDDDSMWETKLSAHIFF